VEDWFAGADIFVSSPLKWVQQVQSSLIFERPVLNESGELFAAAFGAAVGSFEIDVPAELRKISGVAVPNLPEQLRKIVVNVFAVSKAGDRSSFMYCSEGVRSLAIGNNPQRALRCELTMEVASGDSINREARSPEPFPLWPRRAFALAAAIVAQQLLGRDCAWIKSVTPLADTGKTTLEAVLLQRLGAVANEQLCAEGEFSYVNILGITQDELLLGESEGLAHLMALLRRRGFDQMTRLNRNSVLTRTAINPPALQPTPIPRGHRAHGFDAVQ
ncbi:MAG: hypothetical protein EBZ48_08470, partial [Proteobacteria bacterium]|nr:hypothetical protein [Pseudomonadota bacterium]